MRNPGFARRALPTFEINREIRVPAIAPLGGVI